MSDLVERAKKALEEHETFWDSQGTWLGGETTPLEDMAEDLARALIREREAADRLAEECEYAFYDVDATGPQEFYLALAAYRAAQKETDDDK